MGENYYDIAGETAVVTGSSTGIGRAIAERFAANGVDVVVCSQEQESVDAVADAINDRDGGARSPSSATSATGRTSRRSSRRPRRPSIRSTSS